MPEMRAVKKMTPWAEAARGRPEGAMVMERDSIRST
jgi:hypothetical protein